MAKRKKNRRWKKFNGTITDNDLLQLEAKWANKVKNKGGIWLEDLKKYGPKNYAKGLAKRFKIDVKTVKNSFLYADYTSFVNSATADKYVKGVEDAANENHWLKGMLAALKTPASNTTASE